MSCATEIHKPITYCAARAPFHPLSVFLHFRVTGCPCVWWRRGQIGACHVSSSPFRHIVLPAAGGKETDGQASKPPALSHFLPIKKTKQKKKPKKVIAPAGAQPTALHLSPAPEMSSSTFPQALSLLSGQMHDATSPPSEHPHGSAAKRASQTPAKPLILVETSVSTLGQECGCLSETSPVLCTELFTSSRKAQR